MGTMSSALRDSAEFARGRNGEKTVARILQEGGWYIIPSYDYSGDDGNKAPKLKGYEAAYAIPDLDISRNGRRLWAEVKTKAAPNVFRKAGNRLEHGIDLRLFKSYLSVEKITGTSVVVFIYEESTGWILCRQLSELNDLPDFDGTTTQKVYKRIYLGERFGGMVNWPREAFREFMRLTETP